ncbi:hypothetical protein SAMN04488012_102194 [Palleronia salina]|uniref:Flagellar motor switch protein n=2 Tax=Palleronia TaxID=315422 RepID=A0A1M6CXM6_9RHOB|nr:MULTISPECIES: hypothetical protein [Palleronia]SEN25722.1 hypothetical protein SAMN04488011_103183 [Palleronia pelagia]SHI65747.1 hypothetical protein SAMN04488012_102194 [Palleronia salina]
MFPGLIDTVILVLLVGTIGYAYLLDRKLKALMAALRDIQPMVGEFSDAVDRSAQSVAALRDLSDRPAKADTGSSATPRQTESPKAARKAAPPRPHGKSDLVRTFFDMTRDGKSNEKDGS